LYVSAACALQQLRARVVRFVSLSIPAAQNWLKTTQNCAAGMGQHSEKYLRIALKIRHTAPQVFA
jgi:hypothetical protein